MSIPTLSGRHPLRFGKIDSALTGDTTLVEGTAGKQIRVIGFTVVAGGATDIQFLSGITELMGAMSVPANGVLSVESNNGVFETASGEDLIINSSGTTIQQSGWFTYIIME